MNPLDQRTDLPLNLGMTLDASRGREVLAVIEQMPLAGTNKIDRKALALRATELAVAPASSGA